MFDTSKIDEWDLDTCRDWLAERAGWVRTTPSMIDGQAVSLGSEWHRATPNGSPGSLTWCIYPIPATLDEAAKLPDGWLIDFMGWNTTDESWSITARKKCPPRTIAKGGGIQQWWSVSVSPSVYDGSGEDGDGEHWIGAIESELLLRFRLRCKVESVQQGKV